MSSNIDRSKAFLYLRIAAGVVLFIFLIRIIDLQQMGIILVSARPVLIALAFLTLLLNFLLKTYRWALILWLQEPDISFGRVVRFNFISMFLANFLPGNISSDIVRFYQVSRYTSKISGAMSSIIVDRIIGNFSTAAATIIAFIALQQTRVVEIGSLLSYGILGFLLIGVAGPLALQSLRLIAGIRRLLGRFIGMKLLRKVRDIYEDFVLYRDQHWLMLKALSLSFVNLFIAVFEFYIVAIGFSSETWIGYYFIFVPIGISLTMIPISLGGMGVLEASMVFFFSRVGMPVEMCLSIVIVRRALFLLSTIPGGLLYMLEGFPVREAVYMEQKNRVTMGGPINYPFISNELQNEKTGV